MMNKKMLGVFFFLIFIVFMISPCYAGTVEKDYGEFVHYGMFTFNVKAIVETEKDGTWRPNTTYHIYFRITLTGVNVSDPRKFDIYFNETELKGSWIEILEEPDLSWSFLNWYSRRTETLVFKVKTHPTLIYREQLYFSFCYYYDNPYTEEIDYVEFPWFSTKEPLYIDVTPSSESFLESQADSIKTELNIIKNLMYTLVATTIILIVTTVYFAKRRLKTV
jgi:hypothetical protein